MQTLPATLNSAECIGVRGKFFFVDGTSTDGTLEYLKSYERKASNASLLLQDGSGLYEALNQGIQAAVADPEVTHIGMLHSDDRLLPEAYSRYLSIIGKNSSLVFYSDIEFHDSLQKRVRVWRSGKFSKFKFRTGWMPPHTSVVVAKQVYQQVGLYNVEFGTAADYEWVVRVISKFDRQLYYFPERTLSMLVGGASSSSLKMRLRANALDGKVWADESKMQSLLVRVCKPTRKIGQFWNT